MLPGTFPKTNFFLVLSFILTTFSGEISVDWPEFKQCFINKSLRLLTLLVMGDNIIYFAVGFKSYDIIRSVTRADEWYEWTERGRNLIRRTTFNRKTMAWLCETLKEASKIKGNHVKRWKFHDHFSEFFCARNYNNYARYITIISVQGRRRSVIIIPEMAFNTGWLDIALKIERFINNKSNRTVINAPRITEEGLLYSETTRRHKWSSREMNEAMIQTEGDTIRISGESNPTQNVLLGRSLVGSLPEDISDIPVLSEIRRWASSTWKQAHGTNIYEMGHNLFLFEFSSKVTAEHVLRGDWSWKKHKVKLQWWSPTAGSVPRNEKINQVWIRLIGLPLHLWSQKVFKEVGDFCGGWIQMRKKQS